MRLLFLILLVLAVVPVWGQVTGNPVPTDGTDETEEESPAPVSGGLKNGKLLDDSTKQVYGPTTTRFLYENSIKENRREAYHVIDTLLQDYHRFNFVNRYGNLYQDLGNIGTAITPIYHSPPRTIGARSGFHAYDLYFLGPDRIKYYDSKSPFTDLNIVFGGEGRSVTDVSFSRNISPHWNAGFDYQGIFTDKTIQKSGRGDRNVKGVAYDFYTHYHPDSIPYELLAYFSRNKHTVFESGGVRAGGDAPITPGNMDVLLFADNINPYLEKAESRELRMHYHLFHQYRLSDILQVYHEMDKSRQVSDFEDEDLVAEPDNPEGGANPYVGKVRNNTRSTQDRMLFRVFQNEIGAKGNLAALYYNVYYKLRQVDVRYNQLSLDTVQFSDGMGELRNLGLKNRVLENYGGASVRLDLDSLTYVKGFLEYQVGEGYQIGGGVQSKWFEGRVERREYQPSYLVQAYAGNHHAWGNRFERIAFTELSGSLKLDLEGFSLSPFASVKSFGKYVYFDQDTLPVQADGTFEVLSAGFRVHKRFLKYFHVKNRTILTSVSGDAKEAVRVPKVFSDAQLYYENILFDGNLQLQVGLDLNYKSAYYANAYSPVLRQFHRQDKFESPAYPNMDFFINMKINRGRLFLKYLNLWKAFNNNAYVPTPLYPGQVNVLDFGFSWAFYD